LIQRMGFSVQANRVDRGSLSFRPHGHSRGMGR
jgi:hypothetical protein